MKSRSICVTLMDLLISLIIICVCERQKKFLRIIIIMINSQIRLSICFAMAIGFLLYWH